MNARPTTVSALLLLLLSWCMQAMESVPDDHTSLNRQFLEERMRDQMEEVVLTQRRRWGSAKK